MGRKKLADDAPDDGTPCGGVEGDEEAGEDDHGGAGGRGGGGVLVVKRKGAHGSEDEEVDSHADAAYDQSLAATKALHDVETKEGHAEVDAAEDHSRHVAIAKARCLEDCCSVVEKKVGPCLDCNSAVSIANLTG